jgi:hypothetical protein|tara:strand:+ start:376 stop:783 length:408 start_codon:yes stop_codon:yes gene_type:complete
MGVDRNTLERAIFDSFECWTDSNLHCRTYFKMTIEPIKEKLDDKIKALNSSRVYKKVTPRGDLSWYIKWASSVTLIIAMLFTSANMFPVNLWIANIGFVGWLIVGMLWHDRSLIVLNAVSLAIYSLGILNHYYGS